MREEVAATSASNNSLDETNVRQCVEIEPLRQRSLGDNDDDDVDGPRIALTLRVQEVFAPLRKPLRAMLHSLSHPRRHWFSCGFIVLVAHTLLGIGIALLWNTRTVAALMYLLLGSVVIERVAWRLEEWWHSYVVSRVDGLYSDGAPPPTRDVENSEADEHHEWSPSEQDFTLAIAACLWLGRKFLSRLWHRRKEGFASFAVLCTALLCVAAVSNFVPTSLLVVIVFEALLCTPYIVTHGVPPNIAPHLHRAVSLVFLDRLLRTIHCAFEELEAVSDLRRRDDRTDQDDGADRSSALAPAKREHDGGGDGGGAGPRRDDDNCDVIEWIATDFDQHPAAGE